MIGYRCGPLRGRTADMQLDIWLQPQQATPSPLPWQLASSFLNDNGFGYDESQLNYDNFSDIKVKF